MGMDALIKIVSSAAPLLGGALGGPAGAAIGSLIASKFGGDVNNQADLIAKIQADPQAALKLMEIQSNNQVELERIHLSMAEIQLKNEATQRFLEVKEMSNARQREVELAKVGQHDYTASILAYTLTVGVFMALGYLFVNAAPEDNKELIVAITSALTTVWVTAMGYYFGSSFSDKKIDKNTTK